MRTVLLVLPLLLVGADCARRQPAAGPEETAPKPEAASPQLERRVVVRHELEMHCGDCHREDSPKANPGALAIFNLNEVDFARDLTGEQLETLRERLLAAVDDEEIARAVEHWVEAHKAEIEDPE